MKINEKNMLTSLLNDTWHDIYAIEVINNTEMTRLNVVDYLVIVTTTSKLLITGNTHIISEDGDETFSLSISQFTDELQQQEESHDGSVFRRRELKKQMDEAQMSALFNPPRRINFYTNNMMDEIVSPLQHYLDKCSAIEILSGNIEADKHPLVLLATDEYPCSLRILFDIGQCRSLLDSQLPYNKQV